MKDPLTTIAKYLIVCIVMIGIGYIWHYFQEPDFKHQFAYTIKKEMQISKKVFFIGSQEDKIKFSPTKYKNLWLVYAGEGKK